MGKNPLKILLSFSLSFLIIVNIIEQVIINLDSLVVSASKFPIPISKVHKNEILVE